jgi:hypothetical protein
MNNLDGVAVNGRAVSCIAVMPAHGVYTVCSAFSGDI